MSQTGLDLGMILPWCNKVEIIYQGGIWIVNIVCRLGYMRRPAFCLSLCDTRVN